MNQINLLPLVDRQSKWPINKLFFLSGMIVFFLYSSVYGYYAFKAWSIERELQSTRSQYVLLQPTQTIMRDFNKKQQLLDKKNSMLALLTKERKSWYTTIEHLVTITPQQLWFTNLSKADKGLIQIKGNAATYSIVAAFMQRMEQDPFFLEPTLSNVESDATLPITRFEIMVKPKGM